ncbi:MAG: 1-deoxy-D-xylulose-5-phosphate reductoisomerase [SAR202 cluster bacterium]|nr:1-deoxy-D-xylulose-5-phosphate reductoisomerase [SAR202 cluster bacterium]
MPGARKGLVVLGSTGSIGRQTLDTVRAFPDHFQVAGLAAGNNVDLLQQQIAEFKPSMVYCARSQDARSIAQGAKITPMEEMVRNPGVDIVMAGTVGRAGLLPTISALQAGRTVCLANKEVIIMAGEMVTKLSRKGGALLPVDSEPSAIWQCLQGEDQPIRRLIITASGGPFRKTPLADLEKVSPEQALKHPTWKMGKRITIDSSTLMNKGFEVIEARWLFNVDWPQIEVVVHPQSLVHSMVEFADGSVKAQVGPPDMRLPIQYAMLYPERRPNESLPRFDITVPTSMTFEPLDPARYPCFTLALEAGKKGGTYPAVLSAADEVAVQLYLDNRIRFTDIPKVVERTLEAHTPSPADDLEAILGADDWARARARETAGVKS